MSGAVAVVDFAASNLPLQELAPGDPWPRAHRLRDELLLGCAQVAACAVALIRRAGADL